MCALRFGLLPGSAAAGYPDQASLLRRLQGWDAAATAGPGCVLVSSPGRVEIIGNHTDHQGGLVIAAAVDRDICILAHPDGTSAGRMTLDSDLEGRISVEPSRDPRSSERGTAAALLRGVCAVLAEETGEWPQPGLALAVNSILPPGAGMSSSAALAVGLAVAINHCCYGGVVPTLALARAAQRAEVDWFGKPVGLLDQLAVASGGSVLLDLRDHAAPGVHHFPLPLHRWGLSLLVVSTPGGHAGLDDAYAAIPGDLKLVAECLGVRLLSELDGDLLPQLLLGLRASDRSPGDRAILRALHFAAENRRVRRFAAACSADRVDDALALLQESGSSSWKLLDNVVRPIAGPQDLAVGLALAEVMSGMPGSAVRATRLQGGGFGGSFQVYLDRVGSAAPDPALSLIRDLFGEEALHPVRIREAGSCAIASTPAAG